MSKWLEIFALDVVLPTRYRLLGIFPSSLCYSLFAICYLHGQNPHRCVKQQQPPFINLHPEYGYSVSNLFISIKNTNKLTVITHSFASLMPELPSRHAKQASPDTVWLGTVLHSGLSDWFKNIQLSQDGNWCSQTFLQHWQRTVEVNRSLYKHGILDYIYWVCFYSIASKTSELNWYILDMYDAVRQ